MDEQEAAWPPITADIPAHPAPQAALRQLHVAAFWRRLQARRGGEGLEEQLLAALQVRHVHIKPTALPVSSQAAAAAAPAPACQRHALQLLLEKQPCWLQLLLERCRARPAVVQI